MSYENVTESNLHSFEGCREFLDKGINRKNTLDRPIANNTRVEQLHETLIAIKYHNTYIVKYYDNGDIQFDTGGWKTISTKDRMNRFSPYSIWSERHIWYISKSFNWHYSNQMDDDKNPVYHYQDNVLIDKDGKFWGSDESGLNIELKPYSKEEEKAKRSQLRKVDTFIRNGLKKLKAGEIRPSTGDCFICQAFNGQPIADKMYEGELINGKLELTPYKDKPHLNCLQSHIDEGYFHFSLLMNAVKSECYDPEGSFGNENMTYGLAPIDKHNISCLANPDHPEAKPFAMDLTFQRLQKILKQFIVKQLNI